MEIIAIPPFVTGSVTWQEQPGQWSFTVVCKLTYALDAGTATVAHEQEAINEQDNHWDDDPERSVYAPSDLAPYKPRPEVVLVGSAFAPRGEPVRSLFARLIVGGLDKSIEVFAPRAFTGDGALTEGPRFAKMALRYERAAGGEGSWNPVGVDPGATDAYGKRSLPNLQPPGLLSVEQGAAIPAIGFGPIAARWASRRDKLGALAAAFSSGAWTETPLGMDFDGSYFQSAPEDQRVEELRPDEPIVLEHLHPRIERIATRLPGIRPRTRVEIEGMPPWELDLVPDTLWIDTDRAICTMTFRGQLPLDGRDQPGRIYIGIDRPGEPVFFPERPNPVADKPVPRQPRTPPPPSDDDVELTQTNGDALAMTGAHPLPFTQTPALPFAPKPAAPPPLPASAPPPRPQRLPGDPDETSVFLAPTVRGSMPTWLGGISDEPSSGGAPISSAPPIAAVRPLAQPAAARAPAPPPPVSQILRTGEPAPFSMTAASNRAAGLDVLPHGLAGQAPPAALHAPPIAPPPLRPSAPPLRPAQGLPGIVVPPSAPAAPPIPPPVTPSAGPSVGTTVGQAAVLAAAKARGAPPPSSPGMDVPVEKERSRPGKPDPRTLATAAFLGAAEASNAATTKPEDDRDADRKEKPAGVQTAAQSPLRLLVDFLWFTPELPPRLGENEAWRPLIEAAEEKKEEPEYEIPDEHLPPDAPPRKKRKPKEKPEKTAEEKAKDEKSRVAKVISRAQPTLDVENALFSAVNDDGVLEPPLCVVAGDLELPFDEIETLKVLSSAAAPLAVGDKKLKETLDLANEALGTPLGNSPEVAASFSLRVRDAWIKANRMLPPDYLDVHSRRVLLEQRKYQMRELVGASWIRSLLHGSMSDKPIPTYLPADLAKKLPLFVKFSARLIVEVLPQQDQNESHPVALRALALARTVSGRPRR